MSLSVLQNLTFPYMPSLMCPSFSDGYFDGIYLVGPFVVGQDGFGRKFRFFGNPDYLAGIISELCIAEIGKNR